MTLNVPLILLNILFIAYFIYFIKKSKFTLTSLILCLHILLYVIGFLVIGYDPNGPMWDYLVTDYKRNFVFPLGTGERALSILTFINFGIFLGLFAAQKTRKKVWDHFTSSQKTEEKDEETYYFYFGMTLLVACLAYEIAHFVYARDFPLYNLFLYGGAPRDAAVFWGFNRQRNLWIFSSSIERQFLQILLPLSSFFLLASYHLNQKRKIYFILALGVTVFFLIAMLKKTPLILYGLSIVVFCTFHRAKINHKAFMLSGIFIASFGLAGMSFIHHLKFSGLLESKPPIVFKRDIIKSLDEKEKFSLPQEFKTSKVPIDFSTNMFLKIQKYNQKHYLPHSSFAQNFIKNYSVWNHMVGRVFIAEMISTYMLCENRELQQFFIDYRPFSNYLQKIKGEKVKTVYEILFNILAGVPLAGAISIGFLFELYFFLGVLSLGIYIPLFYGLCSLDVYIIRHQSVWLRCFCAAAIPSLLQFFFKGSITGLFTGGLLTICMMVFVFLVMKKAGPFKETGERYLRKYWIFR